MVTTGLGLTVISTVSIAVQLLAVVPVTMYSVVVNGVAIGLAMLGEGERKRKKHGAEYRRQWRKV